MALDSRMLGVKSCEVYGQKLERIDSRFPAEERERMRVSVLG